MIGELVGSYRIVSQLGAGGMGAVWLGEHTLIGSTAAIKILRPEYSENKTIVQRFFDEARAATRINHPGIVTVHDFGWQQGNAYLVMEHLRGESLSDTIEASGRVEPARALRLMHQCARAMAAAHAVGIVHRDLKPDNIYVLWDPHSGERIKILDFGIAKLLGDDPGTHGRTQTGLIMGTPAYMSPEQCRGAGDVDHRTDIYALGCVLFHLVTGRPPFTAVAPGDLIASHLTLPPPVVSSVIACSASLDALVARCLAKDVRSRIASMDELGAAIEEITTTPSIGSAPTFATQPAPAASAITTSGYDDDDDSIVPTRGRGRMILLASLLVAASIVVVIVLATRDPARMPSAVASPDARPPAADATPPLADAASIVVVPDVRPAVDAGATTPSRRVPPRRGSGVGHPAGTGSAANSYDPYDDR
ncbi:MAG: serine/threonine-protein kinase [Proteobacteria bacterium]|nr:serine/threonine-protein kinase [Pseudomonadota bacterium]